MDALKEALIHFNYNRAHAARALGVSIRTFRNWIRKYKPFIQEVLDEMQVTCVICSVHFQVSNSQFFNNYRKVFFCGEFCREAAQNELVNVFCWFCEKSKEVTRFDFVRKINGRFYCNDECVKQWNRWGCQLKLIP